MNVLELAGIARTYPGPPEVRALRPIDLTVPAGEFLAVVGPSGSGKSTLLNLVGLLDRPTDGTLRIDGIDTGRLPERDRTALRGRRIGFVFQSFHLLNHRTALENVALGRLYSGVAARVRRAAAAAMLSKVDMGHRAGALAGTLSGGERQRVAIARALINEPSLLLCDEPTGNLDSTTSQSVLEVLERLHRAGVTIVMITHDPLVAQRAERIVRISDGELHDG